MSYLELKENSTGSQNLKEQFGRLAEADFHKVIELTNRLETTDTSYKLYLSRGIAHLNLNKTYTAWKALLKAKEFYQYADEMEQDVHELKEIKEAQKQIARI